METNISNYVSYDVLENRTKSQRRYAASNMAIDAMSIQAIRISEVLSNGPKPGPFSRFISVIKNNSINTRAMTGGFIWVLHCLNPFVSKQGDDSA